MLVIRQFGIAGRFKGAMRTEGEEEGGRKLNKGESREVVMD